MWCVRQVPFVERFHINHVASATGALVCLVTLTFDLESGAHYCPWSGQSSYQFWCFWDFSFSNLDLWANTCVCQTLHVPSQPLPVTVTWWLSTIRVYVLRLPLCVPSLKFVCLSVWKIWCTSGLSISRPGDLDLWRLTMKVCIIAREVGNLLTNFDVSRTYRSRRIGRDLSRRVTWFCDWPSDILVLKIIIVLVFI